MSSGSGNTSTTEGATVAEEGNEEEADGANGCCGWDLDVIREKDEEEGVPGNGCDDDGTDEEAEVPGGEGRRIPLSVEEEEAFVGSTEEGAPPSPADDADCLASPLWSNATIRTLTFLVSREGVCSGCGASGSSVRLVS